MDHVTDTLTERYGAPAPWRRRVTIAGVVVLAVICLGWLAWAAWLQATPKVTSQLDSFTTAPHRSGAVIQVRINDTRAHPQCTVQALAADHSIVGARTFTPVQGENRVTVRTERTATSVDLVGCTADGQNEPR